MTPGDKASLQRYLNWLYPNPQKPCLCDSGYKSLGIFNGINMGKGWVRITTHPKCPHHALCQGYTAEVRAARPSWSKPWCPVHKTKNCPQ